MMSRNAVSFVVGSIIGAVAMYFYAKHKMEKEGQAKINEAIDKMNKEREKNQAEIVAREKACDEAVEELNKKEEAEKKSGVSLEEYVKSRGYNDYSTKLKDKMNTDEKKAPSFSGISLYDGSEDFAESTYECLTYYYDGKNLTDGDGVVQNSDFLGPMDLDTLFSDEDTIYVRNDNLQCDYEIIFDPNVGGD